MAKSNSVTVAQRSALNLGQQISAGWSAAARSVNLKSVQQVLICGMGGSALGADVITTALSGQLRKPVVIERSYQLPGWVSRRTLVICVSYSGNTQETLTCFKSAVKLGALVVVVATGGKLVAAARAAKKSLVLINDAALNPSRQPRLGLGFSIGALLRLLDKAGVIKGAGGLVQAAAKQRVAAPSVATVKALTKKSLAVVGVHYLAGAAHAVANCINENAKAFAAPFSLPELDHHLLEGLSFPSDLHRNLAFVVFAPPVMPRPLANQYRATLQILRQRKFVVVEHRCDGQPLAAALGAVSWGTQLSIQLAARTKTEPLAVPWVQWLKGIESSK